MPVPVCNECIGLGIRNGNVSVAADILSFASTRPLWEQDLLRRIYTQADLSPEELGAVLALVKKAHNVEGFADAPDPIPLSAEHVLHQPQGQPTVVLASIGEAENVMRLAKHQVVPFAISGVTVIYGENGSGKSGYCKLLKQICRARRERAEDIVLRNVYDDGPSAAPAVNIRFRLGTDEDPTCVTWREGDVGPSELSRFSVFDSAVAPLYADKEGKVEFLPAGLDVLPRLVKACDDLAQQIGSEIQPLKQSVALPLPATAEGTEQATAIAALVEKTPLKQLPTVEELRSLDTWSDGDEQEIGRIVADLALDPAVKARTARQAAAVLRSHLDILEGLYEKLSDEAMTVLAREIAAYCSARDAAQVAATEQFKTDPLGAVIGGEPWRQMFVYAAKVYAAAFPDREFPSEGEARICPLCEQKLDEPAFDRIKRFQAFVAGTAREDAEIKARRLAGLADELRKVVVPTMSLINSGLAPHARPDTAEAELLDRVIAWIQAAATRKEAATTAAQLVAVLPALPDLPRELIAALAEWHSRLEATAVEAEGAAQEADHIKKLKDAQRALMALKVYHENLQAILVRREQLVLLKQLSGCLPPRYTQPISVKNTELCQRYLTEHFGSKLRAEMKGLAIDYLPVTVRTRTDRGVNYVGPDLTKSVRARISNVLSEGEFRALSIACFFAEIDAIDGHSGVILDDPVSSLDHNHIRQVAARLVEEAAKRQVIVFTHELSFYYELWQHAAEAGTPLTRHWVRKTEERGFGTVEVDGSPWQAKSTRDRLAVLDQRLALIKSRNDQKTEAYERVVTDFYACLRETWERLVEEKLLNGVVGRFQPGVQTQSLSSVEVTDSDHRTVYFAMKNASQFSGHDWAKGRLPRVPQTAEMQAAVAEARTYLTVLNKRAEKISSERRKAVESPPVGMTI
jgi:hypothetical protein